MPTLDHHASAIRALGGERWSVTEARAHIPATAGLYAIYGGEDAWHDLGCDWMPDKPLYVGKSEDNLVRRELDTHFDASASRRTQTGSSTVRRSFAALLRQSLELRAVPRNLARPGHFSNFGLSPDSDARLTTWMHSHLTIAAWQAPADLDMKLSTVEDGIIIALEPPLNLRGAPNPSPRLRAARKAMATEAREWMT